jgi:hypothetical protein
VRYALTLIVAVLGVVLEAQAPPTLQPLDTTGRVTYFIAEGMEGSTYKPSDRELAAWALGAWERTLNGAVKFEPGEAPSALIRVHWVPAGGGQYGEMLPFVVNGRRGAAVMIRPDTDGLGPDIAQLAKQDPLLREAIVYLTCLHELGHALGLPHTSDFRDIMYAFGYGGDIPAYFGRYRNQLKSRADIARVSGLSDGDVAKIRSLYSR